MNKRQLGMWSKAGGTEGLRIIASISWGCVGDGDAGISLSSSQSNGIYVQHSGLQQGNKCLSLPQSHVVTPSPPTLPLPVCHLCIFTICVFIFPLVLCLHSTPSPPPPFFFFCNAFSQPQPQRKKKEKRKKMNPQSFSLFIYIYIQRSVADAVLWPCGGPFVWMCFTFNGKITNKGRLSESEWKETDEMQMFCDKSQQKKNKVLIWELWW